MHPLQIDMLIDRWWLRAPFAQYRRDEGHNSIGHSQERQANGQFRRIVWFIVYRCVIPDGVVHREMRKARHNRVCFEQNQSQHSHTQEAHRPRRHRPIEGWAVSGCGSCCFIPRLFHAMQFFAEHSMTWKIRSHIMEKSMRWSAIIRRIANCLLLKR